MAIADDLNSIRTHLEDDYTALETLGVSVEDRNIENIKDMANQIYAKFPKTSYAEGSNITLSNTLKGKLDFEDGIVGYGDTEQAILPSEYQQVEYIESSGTQYIDTGVELNNNSKVEMICKINSLISGNTSYPFFGYREAENGTFPNNKFALWVNTDYSVAFNFGTQDTSFIEGTSLTTKTKLIMSKDGYYVNDDMLTCTSTNQFENTKSATIFAIAQENAGIDLLNRGVLMTLYSLKIWNSSTLVRDLIPCYRISDNVIGLYDLVSNTFLTNSGTGTFTKGANAPTPTTPIPIEVVTGEQEVVVRGKNEIPFPYYDSDVQDRNGVDWSVNSNGTINASGTADATSSIFYLTNGDGDIYLEAGTYKISTNLFTDANGFSIQVIQIVNGSYGTVYYDDMVLTETTRLRTRVIAKPNVTVNVQNAYLMIEPGSSATTYEPYQTPQTYQLSLGEYELYEDSTIVRNSDGSWKYVDNWYRLTSSVLSGFTIGVADSDGKKFVVTKGNFIGVPAPKPGKIYCTHLRYNSSAWYADGYCGIVSPGATLWMQMVQAFESVDAFKTFITTNNMEIVYQTEQPIETPITDTTLINQLNAWYNSHSFTGTTIIEIDGQLPLIIKVRALKGE